MPHRRGRSRRARPQWLFALLAAGFFFLALIIAAIGGAIQARHPGLAHLLVFPAGGLLGLTVVSIIRAVNGLRTSRQIREVGTLYQSARVGRPTDGTFAAALREPPAGSRPTGWKRGRVRFTPAAVIFERRGVRRVLSLTGDGNLHERQADPFFLDVNIDLHLPSIYRGVAIRVIRLAADGSPAELAVPAELIDMIRSGVTAAGAGTAVRGSDDCQHR